MPTVQILETGLKVQCIVLVQDFAHEIVGEWKGWLTGSLPMAGVAITGLVQPDWIHPPLWAWALLIFVAGLLLAMFRVYVMMPKVDDIRVTRDNDAMVVPFAQRETIDMIIGGIFPGLEKKVVETNARCLPGKSTKRGGKQQARIQNAEGEFQKSVKREIQENYEQPFMMAVAALPRHDLAAMAEALVNLTKFRARMSVTQKETVGGPIDVAVLSKGEGRGGPALRDRMAAWLRWILGLITPPISPRLPA